MPLGRTKPRGETTIGAQLPVVSTITALQSGSTISAAAVAPEVGPRLELDGELAALLASAAPAGLDQKFFNDLAEALAGLQSDRATQLQSRTTLLNQATADRNKILNDLAKQQSEAHQTKQQTQAEAASSLTEDVDAAKSARDRALAESEKSYNSGKKAVDQTASSLSAKVAQIKTSRNGEYTRTAGIVASATAELSQLDTEMAETVAHLTGQSQKEDEAESTDLATTIQDLVITDVLANPEHEALWREPSCGHAQSSGTSPYDAQHGARQSRIFLVAQVNQPTLGSIKKGAFEPEEVWRGAIESALQQGTPAFFFKWARDKAISVIYKAGGIGWSGSRIEYGNAIQLTRFVRVGRRGRYRGIEDKVPLGKLQREAFHAWFAKSLKSTSGKAKGAWLWRFIRNQPQYNRDRKYEEKVEEAMSEFIDQLTEAIQAKKQIPTYDEIMSMPKGSNWFESLTPSHDDPGEKFAGRPDASRPMSEALFYASIWVTYRGYSHPLGARGRSATPAETLSALKLWFARMFRPNWSEQQLKKFLER